MRLRLKTIPTCFTSLAAPSCGTESSGRPSPPFQHIKLETVVRGKFPGLVFIKRISEHKRGTRHLHLSEKVSKFNRFKKTRVFRKADMTAWMEQELFLHAGSS